MKGIKKYTHKEREQVIEEMIPLIKKKPVQFHLMGHLTAKLLKPTCSMPEYKLILTSLMFRIFWIYDQTESLKTTKRIHLRQQYMCRTKWNSRD